MVKGQEMKRDKTKESTGIVLLDYGSFDNYIVLRRSAEQTGADGHATNSLEQSGQCQ